MIAPKLYTPNLFIRESTADDCDFFYELELDKEISEHFSIDDDRTLEGAKQEFMSLRDGAEGPILLLTIVDRKSGDPIGRFITPIDERRNHIHIDWFYIGGRENRVKGYGTEALEAFLSYCFNELGLERVGIDFFSFNDRVESLYKRKGFKREGTLRHFTRKNGEYIDLVYMSILKDEYHALTK